MKNLIKNPCGQECLNHWIEIENGGDGWHVEEIQGYPFNMKFFASSFTWCCKSQVIDLLKEGYTTEVLDAQPKIVVSDWYSTRTDSGCSYELKVQLMSCSHDVISEYYIKYNSIPKTDSTWNQVSHTFLKYGPGVRFIKFTHGGKDTTFWKGWYGVRVTNSSVKIIP
ncbi:F-box only protein 2-like isoform 1-T3 [Leptodactylus fuscus]|uniref:F-box only protein 2-like n=1 Tax=Leptodactylus fuscus TaxID=238119 RepID=UPI003F4E8D97